MFRLSFVCVAWLASFIWGNLLANGLRGGYLGVRGKGVFGYLSPDTAERLIYRRLLGHEISFLIVSSGADLRYTGKIAKVILPKRNPLTLPSPMMLKEVETVLKLQVSDVKASDGQPIPNGDVSQAIGEEIELVRLFDHSRKASEIEIWKVGMESDGDSDIDLLEIPIDEGSGFEGRG